MVALDPGQKILVIAMEHVALSLQYKKKWYSPPWNFNFREEWEYLFTDYSNNRVRRNPVPWFIFHQILRQIK